MLDIQEFKIPKQVMYCDKLGKKEKLLFSLIYAHVLRSGECTLSNQECGAFLGTRHKSISVSIKKLREAEFITTEYKNKTELKRHKIPSYIEENPKYNIIRMIKINTDKFMTVRRRRRRNIES